MYHKEFYNSSNFYDAGHSNSYIGRDIIRFMYDVPLENKNFYKNIFKLKDKNFNIIINNLEKQRDKLKNNFLLKEIMPNIKNTSFCD